MPRFQVGDIIVIDGRSARVVWLRENANEIEAMDEYIVEFDQKQRRFVVSSALESKQTASIHDRKPYSDGCEREAH
jgi:hypothetical protein